MRQSAQWPEEKTARLRTLAEQGLSGSQIAKKMGLTRNQVIGRCWRLGIRLKGYHQMRVLSTPDVRTIRSSDLTGAELAELYGVSEMTISKARRGLLYKDIPL